MRCAFCYSAVNPIDQTALELGYCRGSASCVKLLEDLMMQHQPQRFLQIREESIGAGEAKVMGPDATSKPHLIAGANDIGPISRSVTGWEAVGVPLTEPLAMQSYTQHQLQQPPQVTPGPTGLINGGAKPADLSTALHPQAQISHHSLWGAPAATSREAFLRERLAAQDEQRQQQRPY
eukprot:COSAG02_NODE_27317_length_612_cov_1.103314_1_plen_177_part_10